MKLLLYLARCVFYTILNCSFNSVSTTGLKAALKRATDIITKKYSNLYNIPPADVVESIVNTSGGDIRSAILNLHFASLKGNQITSIVLA